MYGTTRQSTCDGALDNVRMPLGYARRAALRKHMRAAQLTGTRVARPPLSKSGGAADPETGRTRGGGAKTEAIDI